MLATKMKFIILMMVMMIFEKVEGQEEQWNFQRKAALPQFKGWNFLGPFTVGKTEVDGGISF